MQVCRGAPIVTHLLFIDDCFLFSRASDSEATIIQNILQTYERASGQALNLLKFAIFFSKNTSVEVHDRLSQFLNVRRTLGTGKCLGLP